MAKLWGWLLFIGLPELLCPSAAGRAISPRRNHTPDTCLIFKPHSKTLFPLPGEIPPLRRSLGARSLFLRKGATEDCGPRDSCAFSRRGRVLCRHRRHGCTGLLRCRFTRGGQGGVRGSVHRQMLRSRDLLLARTCLYQAVPERPEAELSCCSRGGCSAETAMPWLSTFRDRQGSSVLPRGCVHRPGSVLGTGELERSGLELLALGAKAGALPRACPGWSPGSVLRSEPDKQEIHKSPFGCFGFAAQWVSLPPSDPVT